MEHLSAEVPLRPPAAEDAALLAGAAGGDDAAFARFVDRHAASVLRFLVSLDAGAEAEDLLQETFLAAWRAADGFRGEGSARSWLMTTARRLLWRARRRSAAVASEARPLEELAETAGWGDPRLAVDLADRLADRLALEQALARLAVADREVVLLVDAEGLSLAEAAAVVEVGLPALKSRLHRARLRLGAALRGEKRR